MWGFVSSPWALFHKVLNMPGRWKVKWWAQRIDGIQKAFNPLEPKQVFLFNPVIIFLTVHSFFYTSNMSIMQCDTIRMAQIILKKGKRKHLLCANTDCSSTKFNQTKRSTDLWFLFFFCRICCKLFIFGKFLNMTSIIKGFLLNTRTLSLLLVNFPDETTCHTICFRTIRKFRFWLMLWLKCF